MFWNRKNIRPESERIIECKGNDNSEFKCKGKFVDYKPDFFKQKGNKNKPKSRFFIESKDGAFAADSETWQDVYEWRYF